MMTRFWPRTIGMTLAFSIVLVLFAILIGYGIPRRVVALLSAPPADYWQINLLEIDRGLQHALTRDNNRQGFMWSLDGSQIGYSSGETGFTVMDWTGRNRRPMTDADTWMSQFALGLSSYDTEWNADKTERIFASFYDLFNCDLGCVHRQRITHDDGGYHNGGPSWSPDGRQILFVSDRSGLYLEIYVMNRDGTNIRQITHNSRVHNWNPAWSRDGRQIAFIENLGTKGEVFIMDANGQNIHRVTYNQMNDAYPAWQP